MQALLCLLSQRLSLVLMVQTAQMEVADRVVLLRVLALPEAAEILVQLVQVALAPLKERAAMVVVLATAVKVVMAVQSSGLLVA